MTKFGGINVIRHKTPPVAFYASGVLHDNTCSMVLLLYRDSYHPHK